MVGELRQRYIASAQCLALTATASEEQAEETAAALCMSQPLVVVAPMRRQELVIEVVQGGGRADFDAITRPCLAEGTSDGQGDAQWEALVARGRTAAGPEVEGEAAAAGGDGGDDGDGGGDGGDGAAGML